MGTSNLNVTELTPNQTGKTVTINDAFEKLDNATQDDFAVVFTTNARTLSGSEFTNHFMFVAGTLSGTGTLTVPLTRRFFAVDNTGSGHALTVKGSTGGTVSVASGDLAILYCDATDVMTLGGATGGGGGSPVTAAAILALDFSGAPTSDPGGGKLWLNGGVLQVGP